MSGAIPIVHPWASWGIAAIATTGVIARPFGWPEWTWACLGAAVLVLLGLLPWPDALAGVSKGTDVYLFLIGMMVLAELARREKLFDWLAAHAARYASGSAQRLFALVYGVGVVVTVFLSNDATAVVLTPAVAAVARAAEAEDPLPYLFTCAFVANAASFVLPISNPANLVIYGQAMPPLLEWAPRYALPSALPIGSTYLLLRWTQRRSLRHAVRADVDALVLTAGGRMAAWAIAGTAMALLLASALGMPLGWPTFSASLVTAGIVLLRSREGVMAMARSISWGVLPLVAGLFVLVEALARTGVIGAIAILVERLARHSIPQATWIVGAVLGVDLGPNLSVTGSLATILWLQALRREGHAIGAFAFLKLGLVVMPPALLLAIAGAFAFR